MATASIATTATAERTERSVMVHAVPVVLAAVGIGLLVQMLFYEQAWGVNFPIFIAVLLAAGWSVRDRSRPRPRLTDVWLPAAAFLLATFVALRGDTTLAVLDVFGALGLTAAALASFAGIRIVERPLGGIALLAGNLLGSMFGGAPRPLGDARRSLPEGRLRDELGRGAPVLRGLLIAIPLLLLFAILFAAADAAFAEIAGDLTDWDLDLGSLPGRTILALVAAWVAAGLLAFAVRGQAPEAENRLGAGWLRRPRLGTTEALTVLVILDLLFAGFVAVQATYLFGGSDTLELTGLTYAEYARHGFFQLLTVAFLVGGLVLVLEGFVRERTRAYIVATIGLVVMTMVVLASAFLRLRLYQDAYGWTELRFYVLAAIAWLAIGAVAAVAAILTDRTRWLPHALVALSVVFGIGFNLIGPVRYIAEQNVARAVHPELVAPGGHTGFDVWYLASLGDDASIVLAEALPSLPAGARRGAEEALEYRAIGIQDSIRDWQEWNLSRERARDLLSR